MKNSIIAIDLDSTLLHNDKSISEKTIKTLRKCQELGAIIVVSTSRDAVNARHYAQIINADFVSSNAGNMITTRLGDILHLCTFPQNQSQDFINKFYNYTNKIYVDCVTGFYGIENDEFSSDWILKTATKNDLLNLTAIKIFIHKNPMWDNEIKEYCNEHNLLCCDVRDFDYYTVTQANTNKYFALEKLMKKFNKKTLFAFGDDYSDLISIQNATYGVAMANSRPEILTKAKYITQSNNDDGVAKFLEKFL